VRSRSNQKGFTIIEVLIVLAIAALILLVVFLAIPGLQSSQSNSARRSDVAKIKIALFTYYSQNNSWPPGSGNGGICFVSQGGSNGTLFENPNPSYCGGTSGADSQWFKDNVIPGLAFYKKITQYFYASDNFWNGNRYLLTYLQTLQVPGNNPSCGWSGYIANGDCTANSFGVLNIPDTSTVWIASAEQCSGNSQITGLPSNSNMVIVYWLANGTSQCMNVL